MLAMKITNRAYYACNLDLKKGPNMLAIIEILQEYMVPNEKDAIICSPIKI